MAARLRSQRRPRSSNVREAASTPSQPGDRVFPPPVAWVVVDHLHFQSSLFEESGDAVRAVERSREEEEDSLGGMSRH
eukprot:6191150-Pleurochrysis_carterae.AAC.1